MWHPWRSPSDIQPMDGLFWDPRQLCSHVWHLGRGGWKAGSAETVTSGGLLSAVVSEWSYELRAPRGDVSRENTVAESLLRSIKKPKPGAVKEEPPLKKSQAANRQVAPLPCS